jgi:hypothetical protein
VTGAGAGEASTPSGGDHGGDHGEGEEGACSDGEYMDDQKNEGEGEEEEFKHIPKVVIRDQSQVKQATGDEIKRSMSLFAPPPGAGGRARGRSIAQPPPASLQVQWPLDAAPRLISLATLAFRPRTHYSSSSSSSHKSSRRHLSSPREQGRRSRRLRCPTWPPPLRRPPLRTRLGVGPARRRIRRFLLTHPPALSYVAGGGCRGRCRRAGTERFRPAGRIRRAG